MGLSPWKSPYTLWAEKRGLVEPEDISGKESVAMGKELEADVREMYKRRHPEARVQVVNAVAQSISRPWAQASLDGITSDPELGTGVLEIKTSGRASDWADGVPVHYLTQVMQYLSVTGYAFADVAALVGDHGLHYRSFRIVTSDPDTQGDMAAVDAAVDRFWNDFVLKDVAPAVVGTGDESKTLQLLHPEQGEEMLEGDEDVAKAIRMLGDIADGEKSLKREKTKWQDFLKARIGDARGIVTESGSATWSRYTRTTIDGKRLKEQWPDVYRQCSKVVETSRLTIKEDK